MLAIIRRAAGLCLLLVISACGEEPPSTASRAVRCRARPSGSGRSRSSGYAAGLLAGCGRRRRTAPDGTPSRVSRLGPVWVSTAQTWGDAFRAPYVHQCVTSVTIEGDATLDMTISSTADLVALNASTGPTSPDSRVVSGTVFEITSNGRQPVGNAWVGWEASVMDGTVAETITDPAGHYRVCGLPRERITLFAAPASGNVVSASVDAGSDAIVDIEIARK